MVEDIKVSDKELKALNDAIESQKMTEKQRMEKEIREKIAAEEKAKQLEEQNKRMITEMEALKKAQEEQSLKLKEEFSRQLEEFKNQKQSVQSNNNPFNAPATQSQGVNMKDPKVLDMIEERSLIEFRKKYNLPEDFGSPY